MQLQDNTPQKDGFNWSRVQAWAQTGLMFLMGLYLIDLALPGGQLGNYINVDSYAWLTWIGAFILLATAGMNVLDLIRGTDQSPPSYHRDPTRAGNLASWLFLGLLALPLILGVGVKSRPLGASAIKDELSSDMRTIGYTGSTPTIAIPKENRSILDWVRAFGSSSDVTQFTGEEIDVIGFVYRDARFAGSDNFMVVRFTLSCCVADARPIGLVVENTLDMELAEDTWVQVQGTIIIQTIDGIETPVIQAQRISLTEQPEQPYLYF